MLDLFPESEFFNQVRVVVQWQRNLGDITVVSGGKKVVIICFRRADTDFNGQKNGFRG